MDREQGLHYVIAVPLANGAVLKFYPSVCVYEALVAKKSAERKSKC